MKRVSKSISRIVFAILPVLTPLAVTGRAGAATWNAAAGAQSSDQGKQALAFLSNELWIHAGDSIHWTFGTGELHTVSFLTPGQIRPPLFDQNGNFVGCPGSTPDNSSFDGSRCVSSAPSTSGQGYTVKFPLPGNFKLVCLVHSRMTGRIHVFDPAIQLPHNQAFYDQQAVRNSNELLSEASRLNGLGNSEGEQTSPYGVTAGVSSIAANGGGSQTVAVMRFLGETIVIHVGDTVEWTNLSTPVFHTVTFGHEPANLMPASGNVRIDPDGVRHADLSSPNDSINSGFLGVPNQETVGSPQYPLEFTRFRVTFKTSGVFNYICGLHDVVGMKGTVIVHP